MARNVMKYETISKVGNPGNISYNSIAIEIFNIVECKNSSI